MLILVALVAAVIAPIIGSGYWDVHRATVASEAGDFATAARYYQSAARLLPWQRELWEQAAVAQIRAGNPAAATPIFESLRRQGVLSPFGWEFLGAVDCANGNYQVCLSTWMAGLHAYPSHTRFYTLISAAYQDLGDYPTQRVWLEKWISTGQAGADDHFVLGSLWLTSDPKKARLELGQAVAMDANFAPAVKTLDASLDLAAGESNSSRRLIILGRGLGLVNEWPFAESAFRNAITANDQSAEAWAWLGEARQHKAQEHDTPDGIQELDRALALDPADPIVRGLRGLYWKRQGKYRAALAEYSAAAALDPENPEWQTALAENYALAGDLISALASYQKAVSLAPQNAAYWRLLASFCVDNGIQVLDVGLPAARKAAELSPKDGQVLDTLGWTYAQAGYLYNAEQTLKEASKISPDLATAHLHLAEVYLQGGQNALALDELNRTIKLDPEGPAGTLAAQLLHQYFP